MKAIKIVLPGIFLASTMAVSLPTYANGGEIHVVTKEWALITDKKQVKAGKYTISVKNTGQDTHEVEVVKVGNTPHNKLPLTGNHGAADDGWVEPRGAGELEDIGPGQTKKFTVELTPGKWALICNMVETEADGTIEAHYSMGMSAPLTVK